MEDEQRRNAQLLHCFKKKKLNSLSVLNFLYANFSFNFIITFFKTFPNCNVIAILFRNYLKLQILM